MIEHLPILIPLTLLMGALLTPLAGALRRSFAYPAALVSILAACGLSFLGLHQVLVRGTMRYHLGGWVPPIGIEYVLDPLASFMTVVILTVGALVFVHSRDVVQNELPEKMVPFFSVSLLLLTGFCGIVLTGDLFNLYVFLEISSLAAYALIAVGEKPSPVAAFRYLLVGTIGASFFLLGLGFLYMITGSLNIADVADILPSVVSEPPVVVGLVLIVTGLAIKMALFPMHGWLPDAYTYAPSAGSALIAPIGTKIGAYVLIRILFYLFDPNYSRLQLPLTSIVIWLSIAGILFGSIMAMAQKELKRMLAYSSVAQIGYIGLGIGLANPLGLVGAVLHTLNHAFMKGGLFLVVGNLRTRLGHSTIPLFDQTLRKAMPWTMASYSLMALSMVGIPPTAGFFSKWYLVLAAIEDSNWTAVGMILLSSLLTAVYFFRVLERVYVRNSSSTGESGEGMNPRETMPSDVESMEVNASMLVPTLVIGGGLVVLGLLNTVIVTEVLMRVIPPGL
ncbi:MAG: monovalent cation/H+ antiporter subunit D family protein [Ignavibacteriae bacterium]|nr:monovalent cation/H+ antiporter subunit D family protein [Ignavibacteriota bacterium]